MSYQTAVDELNKNLELYLNAKCDPAVQNLSKAMYQLTVAIESDFKEQQRLLKAIRRDLEALKR